MNVLLWLCHQCFCGCVQFDCSVWLPSLIFIFTSASQEELSHLISALIHSFQDTEGRKFHTVNLIISCGTKRIKSCRGTRQTNAAILMMFCFPQNSYIWWPSCRPSNESGPVSTGCGWTSSSRLVWGNFSMRAHNSLVQFSEAVRCIGVSFLSTSK